MKSPVLIASMGRCGSSSVAEILINAGYYMGDPNFFLEHLTARFGAKSYYEDHAISELCTRALMPHQRSYPVMPVVEFRQKYGELIRSRNAMAQPWGFKVIHWDEYGEELLRPFAPEEVHIIFVHRANLNQSYNRSLRLLFEQTGHGYLDLPFEMIEDGTAETKVMKFIS